MLILYIDQTRRWKDHNDLSCSLVHEERHILYLSFFFFFLSFFLFFFLSFSLSFFLSFFLSFSLSFSLFFFYLLPASVALFSHTPFFMLLLFLLFLCFWLIFFAGGLSFWHYLPSFVIFCIQLCFLRCNTTTQLLFPSHRSILRLEYLYILYRYIFR